LNGENATEENGKSQSTNREAERQKGKQAKIKLAAELE
jgi:hypothetical protein